MNPSSASDGAASGTEASDAVHHSTGVMWYVGEATRMPSVTRRERLVRMDPAAIEWELDDGRPIVCHRLAERLLGGRVRLDANPAGAAGSGDGGEVDRAEVGRDRAGLA